MRRLSGDPARAQRGPEVAALLDRWMAEHQREVDSATATMTARIVRALDGVLPQVPTVFAGVERFLAQNGFPVVFTGLPPQTAAPVSLRTGASVARDTSAPASAATNTPPSETRMRIRRRRSRSWWR